MVGWYWHRFVDRMHSLTALAVAAGAGMLVAAAGALSHYAGVGGSLFAKPDCGLGRIALAWAAFVILYQLARLAVARAPAIARPLALVGSRSLACFIALCVIEAFLPLMIGSDRTTLAAQVAGLLTVITMYPIARARGVAGGLLTRWRRRLSPA